MRNKEPTRGNQVLSVTILRDKIWITLQSLDRRTSQNFLDIDVYTSATQHKYVDTVVILQIHHQFYKKKPNTKIQKYSSSRRKLPKFPNASCSATRLRCFLSTIEESTERLGTPATSSPKFPVTRGFWSVTKDKKCHHITV